MRAICTLTAEHVRKQNGRFPKLENGRPFNGGLVIDRVCRAT